jgi:hypothetical protein
VAREGELVEAPTTSDEHARRDYDDAVTAAFASGGHGETGRAVMQFVSFSERTNVLMIGWAS